jgi:hypothetical protein
LVAAEPVGALPDPVVADVLGLLVELVDVPEPAADVVGVLAGAAKVRDIWN